MNKKYIGGGFPGIKECISEENIITKESKEKREFSVRKIVSIDQILKQKRPVPTSINYNNLDSKSKSNAYNNLSESFDVQDDVIYNSISNFMHDTDVKNEVNEIDIEQINRPLIYKNMNKTKSKTKPKSKSKSKLKSRL